jgi:hypothetical protein
LYPAGLKKGKKKRAGLYLERLKNGKKKRARLYLKKSRSGHLSAIPRSGTYSTIQAAQYPAPYIESLKKRAGWYSELMERRLLTPFPLPLGERRRGEGNGAP